MRESDFQTDLLGHLRKVRRNWTVLKHSDQFVAGIPDVSVSDGGGRTLWLELKCLRKPSQCLKDPATYVDNQVQLVTVCRLSGFYVVRDPFRDFTMMAPGQLLARHMSKGLDGLTLPQPGFVVEGNGHLQVANFLQTVLR